MKTTTPEERAMFAQFKSHKNTQAAIDRIHELKAQALGLTLADYLHRLELHHSNIDAAKLMDNVEAIRSGEKVLDPKGLNEEIIQKIVWNRWIPIFVQDPRYKAYKVVADVVEAIIHL